MFHIPAHVQVQPLRKNSRQATYVVYFGDETTYGHTYVATLEEAVSVCLQAQGGHIAVLGSKKLLAFWYKGLRFGFGASESDKHQARGIWWANWQEGEL